MSAKRRIAGWTTALLLLAAARPAGAQLGPLPTPDLRGGIGGITGALPPVGTRLDRTVDGALLGALSAPARLFRLIRDSGGALAADPQGWPVVAGQIVVLDLSAAGRAAALDAGFTVVGEDRLPELDLVALTLAPPRGLSLTRAAERLRSLDARAEITFNHVHSPAQSAGPQSGAGRIASRDAGLASSTLGLIDTGVDAAHPAFAAARLQQQGFAGPARTGAHGTAVASLMVGRTAAFAGAVPGASLKVADIYGGQAAGGSSTALARALAWMVGQGVRVVNVSLVGPRNALVERAVEQAQARGLVVVAAVGNDGPAAPPLYPAAYPGVVGVSGVSGQGRILPEAGRGPQVDFAAPGADMAAASPGGGWTSVRGSSFAAPLVAGMIARGGGDARAVASLAREARDLGAKGRDPVFGHGLVAQTLAVAPNAVAARGRLAR